jgi:hypothetical protein
MHQSGVQATGEQRLWRCYHRVRTMAYVCFRYGRVRGCICHFSRAVVIYPSALGAFPSYTILHRPIRLSRQYELEEPLPLAKEEWTGQSVCPLKCGGFLPSISYGQNIPLHRQAKPERTGRQLSRIPQAASLLHIETTARHCRQARRAQAQLSAEEVLPSNA